MLGAKRYRVLHAALSLQEFTLKDLEEHSGVSRATIQTTLNREAPFFAKVGQAATGKQGGQFNRWIVRSDQRHRLAELLEEAYEALPANALTSSSDEPLKSVLFHLDELDSGKLSEEYRESAIEFCRDKIKTMKKMVTHIPPSRRAAFSREVEAVEDRLNLYFFDTAALEVLSAQEGLTLQNPGYEKVSKGMFVFDFIRGEVDKITERAMHLLLDLGIVAIKVHMGNFSSAAEAVESIQRLQNSFRVLRDRRVCMGVLGTFDSEQDSLLTETASRCLLNVSQSISEYHIRAMIIDQHRSLVAETQVLAGGGVYVPEANDKPVEEVIQSQTFPVRPIAEDREAAIILHDKDESEIALLGDQG